MFSLNSIQHLDVFINFIKERKPFCLIRPCDGEYYVLIGRNFNNIDNWHFNGIGSLKDDLSNQLYIASKNSNTYIGIPCPCCNQEIMNYYISTYNLRNENTTYANIFQKQIVPRFNIDKVYDGTNNVYFNNIVI